MYKSVIYIHSYHHGNTRTIADPIAKKFNAAIIEINNETTPESEEYELIGFGAGIDGGKHYKEMLDFVAKFPNVNHIKAFILSTSATFSEKRMVREHKALRALLTSKGFEIIGEFGCKGFTTRSIFNLVGGANKGHPNKDDILGAENFAENLSSLHSV